MPGTTVCDEQSACAASNSAHYEQCGDRVSLALLTLLRGLCVQISASRHLRHPGHFHEDILQPLHTHLASVLIRYFSVPPITPSTAQPHRRGAKSNAGCECYRTNPQHFAEVSHSWWDNLPKSYYELKRNFAASRWSWGCTFVPTAQSACLVTSWTRLS